MTEEEAVERISELEFAVKTLNELWAKECESHNKTQAYVIKLQKRLLGIKENEDASNL